MDEIALPCWMNANSSADDDANELKFLFVLMSGYSEAQENQAVSSMRIELRMTPILTILAIVSFGLAGPVFCLTPMEALTSIVDRRTDR
jgi:hypothetical protein